MLAKVESLYDYQVGKAFKVFLDEKKLDSIHTSKSYGSDIKQFFEMVFGKSVDYVNVDEVEKIDQKIIRDFRKKIIETGFARSTANRKITAIKEFIRFLKIENIITVDISYLDIIKNLKNDSKEIDPLRVDEVFALADFMKTERQKPLEKYYLILLALATALRQSELLSLTWKQIRVDGNYAIITGYGKGRKKFIRRIDKKIIEELKEIRNPSLDEKVFTLSRKNVFDMMQRGVEALKIDTDTRVISFHSIRKTAITFALDLTGDIREAMKVGNHTNLNTVQKYLQVHDYGVTDAVSLGREIDKDLYLKVSHDELLEVLKEMNKEFLFLLNSKLINKD